MTDYFGMQPCGNKPSELPVVFTLIHFTHEWQRIEKTYCTQNVIDVTGTMCGRIYKKNDYFCETLSLYCRSSCICSPSCNTWRYGMCYGHTHKFDMSDTKQEKDNNGSFLLCRFSEACCVRVASGVKSLPRRVCVIEVHSRVKLHSWVEVWVGQTENCPDPEPRASGLQWQLLHHRCNEEGRGQLQVQSRAGSQPAGGAHRVRWAATAARQEHAHV